MRVGPVVLVGRSSSHFTRVARIFAHELGIAYELRPIFDIASCDVNDYGGNPAYKMPVLVDENGPLFGTENICRELVRRSGRSDVVIRSTDRRVANCEELTLHVMQTEVSVIMAKLGGSEPPAKAVRSIENCLDHLDANVDVLPSLSFVEVGLFCVFRHLPFRNVLSVARWSRLSEFAARFEQRESAQATPYRLD